MDPLVTSGLIKAGGSLVSGLLGRNKSPSIRQQIFERARGVMDAGDKYGIHPLELLRSGAGNATASARPGIMTSIAQAGAFDDLADAIAGPYAAEARRREIEEELKIREKVNQQIARPTINHMKSEASEVLGDSKPEGRGAMVGDIDPSTDDSRIFGRPNRANAEDITGRLGESEIYETVAFPINWVDEWAYNSKLTRIAEVTGKTRREIHQEIATAPHMGHKLRELMDQVINDDKKEGTGKSPFTREFWFGERRAPLVSNSGYR